MNEITMVAAAVLLLLAGAGIGFLLGRKGRSNATSKLEETRAEFDDYRRDVTRHFDQTAQQFQTIGQQYRDLYEHMAKGAESFCIPTEPGSALPFSTQTRLPTDVDEAETVIDETPEFAADEQPKDHVVEEPVIDEPVEAEAIAEEGAAEDVEAAEATETERAEAANGGDDAELTAESQEARDEEAEEPASGVEPAAEKKPDESERIYH